MDTTELTFALRHRLIDGTLVVTLHGEIDAWAYAELAPRITVLLDRPHPEVVVDLRPVTFMDAGGLRLLMGIRRRATAQQSTLRLVRSRPRVWRVMVITRLDRCFDVVDALPAALDAPGADWPQGLTA